jgi:hypothetical protein
MTHNISHPNVSIFQSEASAVEEVVFVSEHKRHGDQITSQRKNHVSLDVAPTMVSSHLPSHHTYQLDEWIQMEDR